MFSGITKHMTDTARAPQPPTNPHVTSLPELGRIVRSHRRAAGLRIDDAAALCGVSVDLLSRLENGRSGVSTDRLLKVLDALGLALAVIDKAELPRLRSGLIASDAAGTR